MLAERMQRLGGSKIRAMFEAAAKMKDPINLSLGQPDFDVPQFIKDSAIAAIQSGKNGYSVTSGIPEFRAAVRSSLLEEGVKAESEMAIAGASGGLILALMALADPGSEVIAADPYFVAYGNLIQFVGANPVWIDTYPNFKITPKQLEAAVTPRSKVFLFNSPGNPTGIAYTADEIKALAATARRLGLTVISDEVYDKFCFDFPHECWLKHDPNAVLIRTFGKTWGMPGWRAGYAAGPKQVLDAMATLQQFTYVCVHTPTQWACIDAFKHDHSEMIASYRKKRDFVYEGLRQDFNVEKPTGTFYIFPEAPGGDGERFIRACMENEILVVPGNAFSQKNSHFRVSFAASDEVLKRGVEKLCRIARSLK